MLVVILFFAFAVIAILILFVMASLLLGFVLTSVPFVTTTERDLRLIASRLALSGNDVVYDLGSGNGKAVFAFERLAGARGVGLEAMLWTHWYAQLKRLFIRSRSDFFLGDFFRRDWRPATVIYCYLYPHVMARVGAKAAAECRPGTRVVARDFAIPNLRQIDYFRTTGNHEVFVYEV